MGFGHVTRHNRLAKTVSVEAGMKGRGKAKTSLKRSKRGPVSSRRQPVMENLDLCSVLPWSYPVPT